MNIELKPIESIPDVSNPPEDYNIEEATVTVENNKLVLSKDAIKALNSVAGDRIAINYWTVDNATTFPLIGRAASFLDSTSGNRLTKSNTVSFRGVQRDILLEYGSFFQLVPFKTFFKLIPIEINEQKENLTEEEQDLNNLE